MKSRRDRASSANSKSCAAESFTLAGDTGGLSTKTPGSVVSCVLPTVEKLAATSVATNIPIRIIHPPLGGHSYPAKRRAVDRKSTRRTPVTNAHLVCRLLLEKKKNNKKIKTQHDTHIS